MIKNDLDKSWSDVYKYFSALNDKMNIATASLSKGVVIFGARAIGRHAISHFKSQNIKILSVIDSDIDKQANSLIDDIPVLSPNDPSIKSSSIIIVAVRRAFASISKQLDKLETIR